jgi:hypothetical protein
MYYWYDYLATKKPLFQRAWRGIEQSGFELWFKKIPQQVTLKKGDEEKCWWNISESLMRFTPSSERMPINISKTGSAQQSVMLAAMNNLFSSLKNGDGVARERKLFFYWLKPLVFNFLIQFFILCLLFIFLPFSIGIKFSAVLLIIPAIVSLVVAMFFFIGAGNLSKKGRMRILILIIIFHQQFCIF